jgi:hypothetical protein
MQGKYLIKFVNKILSINAPMFNLLGSNPGMSGGAGSSQGSLSSGGNITLQLKNQTLAFAKAYQDNKVPKDTVEQLGQLVEGSLMTEETLSLLAQSEAEQLINQLHDLIEGRV